MSALTAQREPSVRGAGRLLHGEAPRAKRWISSSLRGKTQPRAAKDVLLALAGYADAVLYNGLGRYEAAVEGARRACEDDDQGFVGWALAELVEGAARRGQPEVAAAALKRLDERARAADTDWALGVLARSRALVSEGDERRVDLPRGDRAARAHPSHHSPGPGSARLRGMAAPRESPGRRPRATPVRPRDVQPTSARRRSRSAPVASCRRPARPLAGAAQPPGTASRLKKPRSPCSPATGCPTRTSGPSSSSAPAPSNTTCARSS